MSDPEYDIVYEAMRRYRLPSHTDAEVADIAVKALRGHGLLRGGADASKWWVQGDEVHSTEGLVGEAVIENDAACIVDAHNAAMDRLK